MLHKEKKFFEKNWLFLINMKVIKDANKLHIFDDVFEKVKLSFRNKSLFQCYSFEYKT